MNHQITYSENYFEQLYKKSHTMMSFLEQLQQKIEQNDPQLSLTVFGEKEYLAFSLFKLLNGDRAAYVISRNYVKILFVIKNTPDEFMNYQHPDTGNTIGHYLIKHSDLTLWEIAIAKGVNIHIPNNNNITALDVIKQDQAQSNEIKGFQHEKLLEYWSLECNNNIKKSQTTKKNYKI